MIYKCFFRISPKSVFYSKKYVSETLSNVTPISHSEPLLQPGSLTTSTKLVNPRNSKTTATRPIKTTKLEGSGLSPNLRVEVKTTLAGANLRPPLPAHLF